MAVLWGTARGRRFGEEGGEDVTEGGKGEGVHFFNVVRDGGSVIHAPGTPLPSSPVEADGGRSHLFGDERIRVSEAKVGEVDDAHDARAVSGDKGVTTNG